MKTGRQTVILEVISNENIETQTQLLEALEKRGIKTTQATLSRDINELQLVKEGGRYTANLSRESRSSNSKLKTIFREGVISFHTAMNLVVIKTLPGLASAACSALDGMEIEGLVGTIAGDDTCFLAMKSVEAALSFVEAIEEILK